MRQNERFVLFCFLWRFAKLKTTKKGEYKMNTDRIYAEQVANEYAPKDTSKVIALRKLDAKAKLPARIQVYSMGIFFTLLLGLGMCLAMGVVGGATTGVMILGIILGCVAIWGILVNYPIYKKILAHGKKKYAFEIIELAREISKN